MCLFWIGISFGLFNDHALYPEFIREWDTFYKGILIGFIFWIIGTLIISWKERDKY